MLRALLFLLTAFLLAVCPAHAEWRRAVTPHFIIYSEEPEGSLYQFAQRLERFDALLRMLSPSATDTPSAIKLEVFMIGNASRLDRLTGNQFIMGFYEANVEGSFAVVNARSTHTELTPEIILFHEYAHHFMLQNSAATYPAWFVEGYAEFFATAQIAPNGTIRIGGIPEFRSYERTYESLPLRRLLLSQPWDLHGLEFVTYYSDSWYLTHFLTFAPDREGQLRRYLTLLSAGRSIEDAAAEAFGDVNRLSAEYNTYRRRPRLDGLEISFENAPPLPPITIETLSEVEGELQWYRLRYLAKVDNEEPEGTGDLARDVRARAAAAPDDVATLQLLADSEHLAGHRDAAMQAVDRLLELQPQSPRALLRKGLLEIDALDEADVADEERWRAARRWIVRANHEAPDDPLILQQYFLSYVRQEIMPTDTAAAGMRRAFELVPQDFRLRVQLAEWMVARRRHSEAMTLLIPVAFSAHQSDLGDWARALVERIHDVPDGTEARPAPPAEPARH